MSFPPPLPVPLTTLPSHDCNYLPGRSATTRAFRTDQLPGEIYHRFMDAGFRRSGTVIYQPDCADCRACVPIRVPVDRFTPTRSQRRCMTHNQDLIMSTATPELTDEKHALYTRYMTGWHNHPVGSPDLERASLRTFLYESPVETLEFSYRDPAGRLLGVGICDVCRDSLSSVYFYFDPDQKHRSLGTFSALMEIDFARQSEIPFYYLGFWVEGCATMQYKSRFKPYQLLAECGKWQEL